jgi:hypothetical protein
VKLLLTKFKWPANVKTSGQTPLMYAVQTNSIHLVRLLFDHNYEISKREKDIMMGVKHDQQSTENEVKKDKKSKKHVKHRKLGQVK